MRFYLFSHIALSAGRNIIVPAFKPGYKLVKI